MHVVFMIRGDIEDQNRFINELSTRYLPSKFYDPVKKKMVRRGMQIRVCPVQLYDISFQEQNADYVFNTLFPRGFTEGGCPGFTLGKYFWPLRKLLKLLPIPKWDTKKPALAMQPLKNCDLIALGMRYDYYIDENGKRVDRKNKTPLSTEGI